MAIAHTVVRFAYDGSVAAAAPAPPTIVPGVDAVWQCESECADGAEIAPTDLTGARLLWQLSAGDGAIAMWYEDAPFFALTDPARGAFTATLLAQRTDLIAPGDYTLEIVAVLAGGTRARIARATVAVLPAAMAGQP